MPLFSSAEQHSQRDHKDIIMKTSQPKI